MDLLDCLAQKRESDELLFIKEELSIDDSILYNTLDIKEEVASICDDEPGYDSDVTTTQEDKKFLLNLLDNKSINSSGTVLEHSDHDESSSIASDIQIKRKRKKTSKLKGKRGVKCTQKTKDCITKTGRLSRDEIFKDKKYFCSLCQQFYLGRKYFKQHFKHHFTICHNRYACQICNYTASNVSHINRHLLETHFLCDEKNEAEKLFSCTSCGKRFNAKKDLRRHMFVHTGKGKLKCSECDFSCTQKDRLETHKSLFHGYPKTDDSVFKCHYCSYSFESKSVLRVHIKRHLKYKSFKCPKCDYKCSEQGDLRKHCTIHSDVRPFICNECKKTFKRRSHLLIHFNGKSNCRMGH